MPPKNQNQLYSAGKVIFGLFYCGLVAGAYLFAKLKGAKGGLEIFTAGCLISYLIHLAIWPKHSIKSLRDSRMCFRGVLYGLSQVFIFKAQHLGQTSSALVAALLGSIIASLLGRIYLKERPTVLTFAAMVLSFGAVATNVGIFKATIWGIAGGLVQGTAVVTVRWMMMREKSQRESISSGFLIGGIVGLVTLALEGDLGLLRSVDIFSVGVVVVIMIVIQYGYHRLMCLLSSQRAAVLLLSRIPWALAAEALFLGATTSSRQLLISSSIMTAAFLLILEASLTKRKKLLTQHKFVRFFG